MGLVVVLAVLMGLAVVLAAAMLWRLVVERNTGAEVVLSASSVPSLPASSQSAISSQGVAPTFFTYIIYIPAQWAAPSAASFCGKVLGWSGSPSQGERARKLDQHVEPSRPWPSPAASSVRFLCCTFQL